jgi:hypothetical protein
MKCTLRDLFWLGALAALGCGWWLEHRSMVEEIERLKPVTIELHDITSLESPKTDLTK